MNSKSIRKLNYINISSFPSKFIITRIVEKVIENNFWLLVAGKMHTSANDRPLRIQFTKLEVRAFDWDLKTMSV